MSNPVPRFRRRNGNGKNPDGQRVRVEIFFAPCAKKYYSSLDGLDRRNGIERGLSVAGRYAILDVVSQSINSDTWRRIRQL